MERLVGEEDKATLMGREAVAFARYCASPEAFTRERRHADKLAVEVAQTMEIMRSQAGIVFDAPLTDI